MRRSVSLSRFPGLAIAVAAMFFLAAPTWAGKFFEKDGAALRGYDAVAYFNDRKPVKGLAEHKADYKGSTFYFASRANRLLVQDSGAVAGPFTRSLPRATCSHLRICATAR